MPMIRWIRTHYLRFSFRMPVGSLMILICFLSSITSTPAKAADQTKEFINSAVYGTLAGTLVGVASLAFTSQPADNLQNIARGASLGLYAGILLGLYAINSDTPSVAPTGDQAPAASHREPGGKSLTEVASARAGVRDAGANVLDRTFVPIVAPLLTSGRGLEGALVGAQFNF